MRPEAVKISLDDYILAGGGANGESYNHRTDPTVILKLYFPGMMEQSLSEMTLARKVFSAGIETPEPGDFVVTEDGRYGIRFRRIPDKVSFARAVGDHPEEVERYAVDFAQMCRKLHATHVDTKEFASVKDRNLHFLTENPFFTQQEKDKIARFITDAPEADTAIHGDLQFGNALMAGDKRYFIDLGDFCYGHPYFDLGMTLLCCKLSGEAFTKEVFHMDNPTASRFWDAFAPAYFGTDRPIRDIEEEILPYAGLKTLIIERDARCPKPEFRAILEKTIYRLP